MSTAVASPPSDAPPTAGPSVHRFTREQYIRMAETGILDADANTELLDGWIVDMVAQNAPHRAAIIRCTNLLVKRLDESGFVAQVQSTLPLDDRNVPEPDLAVFRGTPDDLLDAEPDDIPLIIEVADSSLARDRTDKLRCYAQNDIPEYWILNLQAETLEVYREPARGEYRRRETLTRDDTAVLAFLDTDDDTRSVAVDQLLPGSS